MTTAKYANPFLDALIISSIAWPFLGVMMLATFAEAGAFRLRFRRGYFAVLGALLRANFLSCAAGGLLMLLIGLWVRTLKDDSWADGFSAAFSIFAYWPWLQLFGMCAWLGLLLLLATPLEQRVLSRSPAFAGIDPGQLLAFVRRVHYVTFSVLALLWLWRCWYLALHPPFFY